MKVMKKKVMKKKVMIMRCQNVPSKKSKVKSESPDEGDGDNSIILASFSLNRNEPSMELPRDKKR